ncbi:MAG: MBL fold metallo-hydrolase [Selenomonadales bacterium]|nr:MBL fold metallo-hydrolase [Selenomonadales bacterium]
MEITYFYNSGFAVKIGENLLVFDYYVDSEKKLPELISRAKNVYFFASHWHGDHFSPKIFAWEKEASRYILSSDIKDYVPDTDADIVWMEPYQEQTIDNMTVRTFGSTDEGVSFSVSIEGKTLFHAGDLNWWHWKGDTEENKAEAKRMFFEEIARLEGETFDIVFFPVDARLEECRTWGIRELCRRVATPQVVAMHIHQLAWADTDGILKHEGRQPAVWCPTQQGESLTIK